MSEVTRDEQTSTQNVKHAWLRKVGRAISYWFKLIMQPLLAAVFVIGMAYLFGYAQRNFDWFQNAATSAGDVEAEEDTLYACSMLCVFVKAPGRCPVCGMELQKIDVPGDPKDIFGVTIDPTARRLANIETVAALNMPIANEIEVLGKVTFDETTEATISSYVDGRVEDLLVDYTGANVNKGDQLALIYSPDLYSDQVGFLSAKKAMQETRSNNERVRNSNQRMYESARRRLIEFGLPESEVDAIEQRNKPDSRVRIFSPMSGTVVEKLIDEGKYVKTGMPILKIADLTQVWLMLELFPKDTSGLKIGQSVTVSMQSQPGRKFEGQISFIDPMVDDSTQTVDVRVVIANEAGLIKIGDFGKARIKKSLDDNQQRVVVPRDAVLMNGDDSVAYVETEPGRFEFRKVEVAEIMGDRVALSSGIEPGEQVAASGVFMLDSTFNIQGKVSLIDPNRAAVKNESQLADNEAEAKEIEQAFSGLSPEDRKLAEEQVICPVTEVKLGTLGMGAPIRVILDERDVMICCEGCRKGLVNDPHKYYAILDRYHSDSPTPEEQAEIEKSFVDLSPEDRKLAEEQVICPVTEVKLGTMGMGTPIRVELNERDVMICCEGCRKSLVNDPEKYYVILDNYHQGKTEKSQPANKTDSPADDIPQMELPQMELPQMELPQMEAPK